MSSTPPAKRQKFDNAIDVFTSSSSATAATPLTIRDVSFQSPLRKKLNLIFTQKDLEAHSAAKQELSIPFTTIKHVICVAAPDKAAKIWNFVVIDEEDAWVFGVPDTLAKTAVADKSLKIDTSQPYKTLLTDVFKRFCKVTVVEPSSSEFSSPIPQPGRPKETAYHAIAHRGAKEGFLYFLSTGILYGFKKPVVFFPLSAIREVTFTNVLQRTFNLVVSTEDNVQGEEFGMIDQACFDGIQNYAKKHSIQDASLSEQRKAKKIGKGDVEEGGELDKAVKEYEAGNDEDDMNFKEFDKAAAEWDDNEQPQQKGKGVDTRVTPKRGPAPSGAQGVVNGEALNSDDEEDDDFESGESDGGSPSGSSDESSDEDDSEEDDEDDDEDVDEDDEEEDEEEEDEDEEE